MQVLSKAQRKKLAQLEARKRKGEMRAQVLASLAEHAIAPAQLELMGGSGKLGQKANKRQRRKRAVQARAAGVELEGLESLEVPRALPDDVSDQEVGQASSA